MTILVTGGAGYIGSHTVRMLRDAGHDVVVLDSMEYGHRRRCLERRARRRRHRATATWSSSSARDATSPRSSTSPRTRASASRWSSPARYWLQQRRRHGRARRGDARRRACSDIVFSSRCSVYGTPAVGAGRRGRADPARERLRRDEGDDRADPRLVRRHATACAPSACATSTPPAPAPTRRIGEDWTQSLNLVPLVMKATLGKRPPVQVFGNDYPTPDGTCIRDYIHVDDLADAHVQGARLPRRRRRDHRAERRHRRRAAA